MWTRWIEEEGWLVRVRRRSCYIAGGEVQWAECCLSTVEVAPCSQHWAFARRVLILASAEGGRDNPNGGWIGIPTYSPSDCFACVCVLMFEYRSIASVSVPNSQLSTLSPSTARRLVYNVSLSCFELLAVWLVYLLNLVCCCCCFYAWGLLS